MKPTRSNLSQDEAMQPTSSMQSARCSSGEGWDPSLPSIPSSECILCQDDLRASVRSLWSLRKPVGPFLMSNATMYTLRSLLRLAEAALNTSYVIYALASATIEGGLIFRSLKRVVLWVEAVVVVGCVIVVAGMFLLLLCGITRPHPASVLRALVERLEMAGNFSMLSFLPLPPKLTYWWNHSEVYRWKLLHPPILNGQSICKKKSWHDLLHSQSDHNLSGLRGAICRAARGVLLVPLIIIAQVMVPLCVVAFPLLAPCAFLVKMEGLPDVQRFNDWGRSDWLSFVGILNQASDMWDVDLVEQRAMLSLVFVVDPEKQVSNIGIGKIYEEKLAAFRRELSQAFHHELGLIRAGVLLTAQDSFVLAFLLHRFLPLRERAVAWDVTDGSLHELNA